MTDFTPLEMIQLGREQTSMYLNTSKNILFLPNLPTILTRDLIELSGNSIELLGDSIKILGHFLSITSDTSLNRENFEEVVSPYRYIMDDIKEKRELREIDYGLIGEVVQRRSDLGEYISEITGNLRGLLLEDDSRRITKRVVVEVLPSTFKVLYLKGVDGQFSSIPIGKDEESRSCHSGSKVILTYDSFKERFIKKHFLTFYNMSANDRSVVKTFFQN